MRATVSIDDDLIKELMRLEPDVSRSEAMRRAVEDYIRRKSQEGFMTLAGSRLVDMPWQDGERLELEKLGRHEGRR